MEKWSTNQQTVCELEAMAKEIVDFPIDSMVMFYSSVNLVDMFFLPKNDDIIRLLRYQHLESPV